MLMVRAGTTRLHMGQDRHNQVAHGSGQAQPGYAWDRAGATSLLMGQGRHNQVAHG